jgi:hypothetical protein
MTSQDEKGKVSCCGRENFWTQMTLEDGNDKFLFLWGALLNKGHFS